MPERPRKMSEILKEMSERLLRNPGGVPSSEAAHVALLFANVAWNEGVGLDHAREGCRNVWETIEADNPELWNEFKSNDIDAMIDELVRYKEDALPGRPTPDSHLRHPGRQGSGGMAERCGPWGRFQMGDAAVRAGADGGTGRGDPLPARDSGHVPQRGGEKGGGGRRRTGDEVASDIRGRGRRTQGLP